MSRGLRIRRQTEVIAELAGPGLCRAPYASMHFDQRGNVRACCQSDLVLGNVADASVDEIWRSDTLTRLRGAMENGDLSLGCGHCQWAVRHGNGEQAYARHFDRAPLPAIGEGPTVLELALSTACNLQCTMCNGEFSSAIRMHREHLPPIPPAYDEDFFDQLESLLPGLTKISLLGGEPFLSAEAHRVMRLVAEHASHIEVAITTNGTVWSDRIERLLTPLNCSFVVSVDGVSAATFESIRVGASWSEVQTNIGRMQEIAEQKGTGLTIAHCLMVENWDEFPDLLIWAAKLRAPVFVNTVVAPTGSSLFHLSAPELTWVLGKLDARSADIKALPQPWIGTWHTAIANLRAALSDHEAGPALRAQPTDRGHRRQGLMATRAAYVIRLVIDERMTVAEAEILAKEALGAPVDLTTVVGRRTLDLLGPIGHQPPTTELSYMAHRRDLEVTDEERVHRLADGSLLAEHRFLAESGGHLEMLVEQRHCADAASLLAEVAAVSAPGAPAITLVIDRADTVVAVEPSIDAAAALGLCVAPGMTCRTPDDVLARRSEGVSTTVEAVDAITNRVEIVVPGGPELLALTREEYEGSSAVRTRVVLTATRLPTELAR